MGILMAVGVQQTGDKPMATQIRYPGDDLDIRAIHPSQRKMKKRQWMGNRPMAVGSQLADFGPRVETDLYLKRARKMGKCLITASM